MKLTKALFLTSLMVENATRKDDGNWRLTASLVYYSAVLGLFVHVPKGFVTNYASVPRWPVIFWLTGDTSSEAAVVHDFLYTKPSPVTRAQADAVLREASGATGVAGWRRYIMWAGVRLFGARHYNTA